MNPYIEQLKDYLNARSRHPESIDGIMELLCYYYTVENSIDNAIIRSRFREMDAILCKLSIPENDAIFRLAVELCDAYRKQAFLAGAQVGVRLVFELQQDTFPSPSGKLVQ